MSPFSTLPRRLAADAYEARIEDTIIRGEDLYELDGETVFRRRDGCVETGTLDAFEREVWL
ncbi:hypothetical protein [Hyphomicrobium sp.]|uniref:hypothetical protein n=1 Tax=Hyphomicrobium sp. TaxID=82 RepID=UPI0025C31ECC|nr:hypothetical protein [Hyphomicrobium sp.]MCC7250449.1 hypothetical protein [Hyphomicrobium sp.]